MFGNPEESHEHARQVLDLLENYNTFMESIDTLCDMGCGEGRDLEWWATRCLEDDSGKLIPLDIKCTGVDLKENLSIAKNYDNIEYIKHDIEKPINNRKFDVIWCHDAFQYVINPLETLKNWWHQMTPGGMLAIIVPSTTEIEYQKLHYTQPEYCYFNYTIPSLMHILAVSGFDCAFMLKDLGDPWIKAVVYKSEHEPMDPRTTRWYHLAEKGLLSESAVKSVNAHGELWQEDLTLEWLNHSLRWYGHD